PRSSSRYGCSAASCWRGSGSSASTCRKSLSRPSSVPRRLCARSMSGAPGPATAAILETVADYYSEKLRLFGATARGVDWSSPESQALVFRCLLKAIDEYGEGAVTDFGCGYGALLDYLDAYGRHLTYRGFDVSQSMIDAARQRHRHRADCS